jgi:glucose-6-phosphate 1-dehydrogenase
LLAWAHHRVHPYPRGSWEPNEADAILAAGISWHNPLS